MKYYIYFDEYYKRFFKTEKELTTSPYHGFSFITGTNDISEALAIVKKANKGLGK